MEGRVRFAVAALVVGLGLGDAKAASLAKETCDAIDAERAALAASGVSETIQKGAAWAQANLPSIKLKEIERYIGLQEQLLFKCGHAKLRTLPLQEPEDFADGQPQASPPAIEPPAAKPKTVLKKPTKPKSEPAASQYDLAPKPPAKPSRKPKADDAYRPPQRSDVKSE